MFYVHTIHSSGPLVYPIFLVLIPCAFAHSAGGPQVAPPGVQLQPLPGMRVVGCMPRLSMHRALIDLLCSQGLAGVYTFLHRCVHRAMICLALFYEYLYVHLYTHAAYPLYDYFVDPPYVYNQPEISTTRFHLQSSGLHACVVSSMTQGGIAGVGMQPGLLKFPPRIGGGILPSIVNAKRSKTRRRKHVSYCCCCCCCCCGCCWLDFISMLRYMLR